MIIVGQPGCGRKTFDKELNKNAKYRVDFCHPEDLVGLYKEDDLIVLIDTAVILCRKRLGRRDIDFDEAKEYKNLLSYVRELPNVFIINNNGSLHDFRVKIKRAQKDIFEPFKEKP